jgi:hypothetical protein
MAMLTPAQNPRGLASRTFIRLSCKTSIEKSMALKDCFVGGMAPATGAVHREN